MTRSAPLAALALAALALVALPACDTADDPEPDFAVERADDVPAPAGGGFTLYSLRTDAVVTADPQASFDWDLGFRGTEVIVNGGTSGPGAGVGVLVDRPFPEITDAVADAPTYRRDGESACPTGPARVVCAGPDVGWYTVEPLADGSGVAVVPVEGRTLLLRLADNSGYAKVRFLSYYRGAPGAPDAGSDGGFYTFEYVANETGTALVQPAD